MTRARRSGFRPTARDEAIVSFIARLQGIEARQLAAHFAMDEADVYRRAARLCERGLLERHRLLHGRPGVYTATRAGHDWVGNPLPPARPSLAAYDHSIGLASLATTLGREFGHDRVLTERELRSKEMPHAWDAHRRDAKHRPIYSVILGRRTGTAEPRGLHFPDLAVHGAAPDKSLLAIELELTSKGATRRRAIVAAYRDGVHIGQVRYYATPEPRRLLERTIAQERANDAQLLFDLRPWPLENDTER